MSERNAWGGLKLFVVSVLILLVIGLFIGVFIGLNILVGGWALVPAAILLGVFLFLIINRTPLNTRLLPILEIFFPIISKLQDEAKRRSEHRSMVDKMEYTLARYRLSDRLKKGASLPGEPFTFTPKFRSTLINELLKVADAKKTLPRCSTRISREMDVPITPKILTLFYRDLHETSSEIDYQEFRQDDSLRMELAENLDHSRLLPGREDLTEDGVRLSPEILLERGHLPTAPAGFPYTVADIARLLKHYDKYRLFELREDMHKLQKMWALTSSYLAFLIKNKALGESFVYKVSDLLDSIEDPVAGVSPDMNLLERLNEQNTMALAALRLAGKRALTTHFKDLPDEEHESLNLIAQGIFFTEERKDLQDLKYAVCVSASQSELALQQYMAYLEFREDLREETALDELSFVSVKYIAEHWAQTIEKRKQELGPGFRKEIRAIRENLADGNWWSRLPWVIEEVLNKISKVLEQEIQEFSKVVANRPPVGDVLRRIFRGLKLATIERFLEARTITAYLLTFDGLEGSMASLIDCLSFFKGGKYRAELARLGVRFTYRDREKYIFKDYIKQCRIGLVPMGMGFDEFSKEFEHHLAIAYENRDKLNLLNTDVADFEIIIHRFGLSGRERHGFDKFNQEFQRKHALPRIQELFASSLFPEDIIALICYEQSTENGEVEFEPIIDGILAFGTITDFVGEDIPQYTQVQKKALTKKDQDMKSKLLDKTACDTMRELARLLNRDAKEQDKTIRTLTRLISRLPEFSGSPQISKRISANYIATVADIGGLYK